MRFTDTEAEVIAFIDERVDPPVSLRVPSPRPSNFVRVWGSGGDGLNRIVDDVQLTIEVWAEDDADAAALALRIRDLLLQEYAAMPLVRRVDATRPYFIPDPDSEVPRYRFTARLRVRAAR
ncbi:hypothetical protein IFU40_06090 [Microbacterium sp. CFBP 13617]|uniref:hypothetical protein n=1 Tax=Microbacterium sp. CFBP 13617 TaxID=2774035 RepID=UPI0017858E09|nr:hypothetical protein [Microbacterium sp. CFBP 13617]MBD8218202.1 hypothetical protein [Microbacterium sp. CFBP 13617]